MNGLYYESIRLISILFLCVMAVACSFDEDALTPNLREDISLDEGSRATADELRDFYTEFTTNAVKYIDEETMITDKNVVVSPLSMSILLSMVANGIEDSGKRQISEFLGVTDLESLNSLSKTLIENLPKSDNQSQFSIANSIWTNNRFSIDNHFVNKMASDYRASIFPADLNHPATFTKLNDWCSQHTFGLISNLPATPSPDVYAILLNALYFNSKWEEDLKFNPSETSIETFYGLNGVSNVDMMHTHEYLTGYYEDDEFVGFDLFFGNKSFYIMVLLPKKGVTQSDINKILTPLRMSDLCDTYRLSSLDIDIPKFKISMSTSMEEILENSGLNIFSGLHEFSIFNPSISGILNINQASSFEIDETGAQAASVAQGIADPTAPAFIHKEVTVDRPFYFFIREVSTGACILSGRIADL